MGSFSYTSLMNSIKHTLKARGLTYRDLALSIDMSESGVKKLFAAKDGSFGKVTRICESLGLTIPDVMEMDATWQSNVIEFTPDQEEYLLADQEALSVFFLTAYDGKTIAESQKILSLSKSRLNKILRQLDQLNLIQWLPHDHTKVRSDGIVLWKNSGKFVEYIKEKWSMALLEKSLHSEKDQEFQLSYFKLTPTSIVEMQQSLQKLVQDYRLRSRHEINFHGMKNLSGFRFLCANAEGSFIEGAE